MRECDDKQSKLSTYFGNKKPKLEIKFYGTLTHHTSTITRGQQRKVCRIIFLVYVFCTLFGFKFFKLL